MNVYYGLENIEIHNAVATIGSFDGVHKGHRTVLENLNKLAKKLGGSSVVITFYPHPREVLYPNERPPGLLNTLKEKESLLSSLGIDNLVVLKFTRELSNLTYQEFMSKILINSIGIKALVVGYDHRFGKNREGDFDSLKLLSKKYGFYLEQEKVYEENKINISSTKIRKAVIQGNIKVANDFLGYNYSISGTVVNGRSLGRKLGFPTANIDLEDHRKLLPAVGVYAVKVEVNNQRYSGMLNIGYRPTVSRSGIMSLEVNIFDFDDEIYDHNIQVSVFDRVRGEKRFCGVADLIAELTKDRDIVRNLLIGIK